MLDAEQPRFLRILCWSVFVVLLAYSSGFSVYAAIILQQCGYQLSPLAIKILFPYAAVIPIAQMDGKISFVDVNWLNLCTPWILLACAWEWLMAYYIVPAKHQPLHLPRLNDTISSLFTGLLNVLSMDIVLLYWSAYLDSTVWTSLRVTNAFADTDGVLNFWLCFVVYDFVFYWYHRMSHWMSWMWAHHVTHHSSENFDLSTGVRRNAVDFLTPGNIVLNVGLCFFFPAKFIPLMYQIGLLYQFWLHTQLIPPLPRWFERILNSPAVHRIHHTRNEDVLGKNHAGVFTLWDWMFGTLEFETANCEARGRALHYGVIPPLNSWNPVWANLHHLHHMIFVETKWRGVMAPFSHWTPPGGRCPPLGSRLNPIKKYDASPKDPRLKLYVNAQAFVVLTVGNTAFAVRLYTVSLISSAFSVSHFAARTVEGAALFSLTLAGLCTVSDLQSASSHREVRRALAANMCFHVVVVALAALFNVSEAAWPSALMAAYLVLHGICAWRLGKSPDTAQEEMLAPSEGK